MNRVLGCSLLLIVCIIISLWSPWLYMNIDFGTLFGAREPDPIAGLQVNSLSGEVEVFLNGESKGVASETDEESVNLDTVVPGENLITLKRKSDIEDAYWEFSKLITFQANTIVVTSFNLGPEEEPSEGHIIYAIEKLDRSKQSQLNVNINVEDAVFRIDGQLSDNIIGNNYFTSLNFDKQHEIEISKDGYETLKFTILPEAQEDRDKLKDFDFNIEVHLMLQPVTVE